MRNTIFSYVFAACAVFVSCGGLQKTQETKEKPVPTKITLPLLQVLTPFDVSNVRFRFERELVLNIVNEPGNGVYEVNKNGDLVLLNDKVVRFPVSKLGKFPNPEIMLRKEATFQMTWEEGNYDEKLGLASLRGVYDDSLRVVISPDGLSQGRPYVIYQKAKYSLPQDYKQYFLVVGEIKKAEGKIVSGVKTPGQEAGGN